MSGTFTIYWVPEGKRNLEKRDFLKVVYKKDECLELIRKLNERESNMRRLEFDGVNFLPEHLEPILVALKSNSSITKITFKKNCNLDKVQNIFTENNLDKKKSYYFGTEKIAPKQIVPVKLPPVNNSTISVKPLVETTQDSSSNSTIENKPLKLPEKAQELTISNNENDHAELTKTIDMIHIASNTKAQQSDDTISDSFTNLLDFKLQLTLLVRQMSGTKNLTKEFIEPIIYTPKISDTHNFTSTLNVIFKKLEQHQHKEVRKDFIKLMEFNLNETNSDLIPNSSFRKYLKDSDHPEHKQDVETALKNLKEIDNFIDNISHNSNTFEKSALDNFNEQNKKIAALEEELKQKNLLLEEMKNNNKTEEKKKEILNTSSPHEGLQRSIFAPIPVRQTTNISGLTKAANNQLQSKPPTNGIQNPPHLPTLGRGRGKF